MRYLKDKQGRFTQDRSLFVNDGKLTTYLEKFVNQLEQIDFNIMIDIL
ncbi:hypothetical protein PSDT_0196 [Parascardovia denticolens DSM 10105 = JCM 12538]|nr:hypothetical protein PSDT_0196 [Parascardovia denticolens DSM 10105 = JCM 12538]